MNFDELFKYLKNNGYHKLKKKVFKTDVYHERCAEYRGTRITFYFYEIQNPFYEKMNHKIYADPSACFYKPKNCCLILPFPQNEHQLIFLMQKLKWLETKEAFEISDNWEYEKFIEKYPEEISHKIGMDRVL